MLKSMCMLIILSKGSVQDVYQHVRANILVCMLSNVCVGIRAHSALVLGSNSLFKLDCDIYRLLSSSASSWLPVTWPVRFALLYMTQLVFELFLDSCLPVVTLTCVWTLHSVSWFGTSLPSWEMTLACIYTLPHAPVHHCPTVDDLCLVNWLRSACLSCVTLSQPLILVWWSTVICVLKPTVATVPKISHPAPLCPHISFYHTSVQDVPGYGTKECN